VIARLKAWAKALEREAVALWFVARDPRTPMWVRVALFLVVAYALSPIDLIPDFLPLIGYLDDILLLPGIVWLLLRLVPADALADGRRRAAELTAKPRSWVGTAIIVAFWAGSAWLTWEIWKRWNG